jgi:ElaB/YqjD/DUF883 family membrane-anchored ribosome-binding protein
LVSFVSPQEGFSFRGFAFARSERDSETKNRREIMAEEDKTTTAQSAASTPDVQDKLESSKTHARKAAEDLRAAAGAVAEEYRGKAEQAWDDARYRARTFQEDSEQYIRENPTKSVFTALGIGFVLGLIFRR